MRGLEASSPSSTSLLLPAAVLAVLGVAATVLNRRRGQKPRLVRVLETASLGPKRSLVVAELFGETLLLGVSEAGIAVLTSRPAPAAPSAVAPRVSAGPTLEVEEQFFSPPSFQEDMQQAVTESAPGPRDLEPSFGHLLAESAEDFDLRRKLAAGLAGVAR